jgi:hypothetical protein
MERWRAMTMTMPQAPTTEREAAYYANKFRQRRLQRLLTIIDEIVAARGTCRILDVGGWPAYWQHLEPLWRDRPIHIAMINLVNVPVPDARYSSFTGDARDLGQFSDRSFDLVHSNSVIEHVGLWRDQCKMAQEIRRLAPRYFVQTPNYWFPPGTALAHAVHPLAAGALARGHRQASGLRLSSARAVLRRGPPHPRRSAPA